MDFQETHQVSEKGVILIRNLTLLVKIIFINSDISITETFCETNLLKSVTLTFHITPNNGPKESNPIILIAN